MGKYVSIRGWLECEEHDIEKIKDINRKFVQREFTTKLDHEKRELYQKGWVFPENQVNWTSYIFYGADLREYDLDFIKDQIREIAEIEGITGHFLIDDHDSEKRLCWQVFNRRLVESEQLNIWFHLE
ncbi:hypothetical protein CDO73_07740 [Saccharibacillus sp. O23]|uniref:hypothetical protein n=1 Tax=Saccharibacillus sp. O23 TaxID=2009338 RepID=UPI000B4E2D2E|nr:hypothetical protein [Saccharibacillus sp. O23]OWR31284.1 hypothetical protein CDO73_07740 [Saccharibacillus sp. O23]